jgi:D-alanine--poly(phosphoribitol) ligase subunit 2
MSDTTNVREQIVGIFESMNLEPPPGDVDLFETGLLDSMAFVQLLMLLEERLSVTVAFEDLEVDHFRTIDHIATFVAKHRRDRRIAS